MYLSHRFTIHEWKLFERIPRGYGIQIVNGQKIPAKNYTFSTALILRKEKKRTVKCLRAEHVTRGGCGGARDDARKNFTIPSPARVLFTGKNSGGAVLTSCAAPWEN